MAIVSMSFAEMNPKTAEQITYDNTTSGLSADNVQDAIDSIYVPMSAQREIWVDPVYPHQHGLFESHNGQTMYVTIAMNNVNITNVGAWIDCGAIDVPEGYRIPLSVSNLCLNWSDRCPIMVSLTAYNDENIPHHVQVDGYGMGTTGLKQIRGFISVPIEKI